MTVKNYDLIFVKIKVLNFNIGSHVVPQVTDLSKSTTANPTAKQLFTSVRF